MSTQIYTIRCWDEKINFSQVEKLIIQSKDEIKKIASSDEIFVILTKNGFVYGMGKNEYGELGLGDQNSRNQWIKLPIPFQILDFSCYYQTLIFISEQKSVYGCGKIYNNEKCVLLPKLLFSNPTKKIVSGIQFLAFLCENNELYVMGCNVNGQLGLNQFFVKEPTLLPFFLNKAKIKDVKAGYSHMVVLLEDNTVYHLGPDLYIYPQQKPNWYEPVQILQSCPVYSIQCSHFSSMFELQNGKWIVKFKEKDEDKPWTLHFDTFGFTFKQILLFSRQILILEQDHNLYCYNPLEKVNFYLFQSHVEKIYLGLVDKFLLLYSMKFPNAFFDVKFQ